MELASIDVDADSLLMAIYVDANRSFGQNLKTAENYIYTVQLHVIYNTYFKILFI